ncbi:serine/threonine protein kinase [Actinoplanes sp. ATCC 53533]|uniref:serine/threonine protein kinase n=1 Tax=Actinoplanes sp. ATCC 53533 TaxID=1288362 RepID=UPI000F781A2E|nr:serine/threonine-protein kinase [Actinoplanes sp. ATCC 53533]RSM40134.1 serine/threonine protein kinase [Actinoplanes sp. ATCC 53533]
MTSTLRPGDPRRLGGYQLLSRLGEGGMGTVFLAEDEESGRLVAVKAIRPEYADEDEFRARFRSEVNRARQVPPFCTAEVLDADPEHTTPYLVVEFVDGPSLAEVVQEQGPLTAGNLHSVAIGVATALAAIHGAGVIHRDLKPRNVLFSLGTPKVIDFGIARAFEATSQHTRTDQMVGTVAYMAPERFDSDSRGVTAAADVFAWGAVVAYAGTGRTPFAADSPAATAARILTQPPEVSGLPRPLRDLVTLALAKEPRDRPSAHELLELLLSAGPQESLTLAQRPELRQAAEAAQHSGRHSTGGRRRTRTDPAGPPRRRRRLIRLPVAGLAALTALALAGAGIYGLSTADSDGGAAPAGQISVAPPAPRTVRGPSIVDRLDRPGQWTAQTMSTGGSCDFRDALVVTTGESNEVQCPGPTDSFAGDQSIAVDVTVRRPGSCALIWFRFAGRSGYRLSACESLIRIDLEDDGADTTVTKVTSDAFRAGHRERLRIDLRGQSATVTVGSTPVLQAPITDPALVAGQVLLGVATATAEGPAEASFAAAEFRSL